MANFGPLSRGQPHSPDVNHCVLHFQPEGHREPCNEVGSLSPPECLVGIEPGTFQFLLQRLNPLGHSPRPRFLGETQNTYLKTEKGKKRRGTCQKATQQAILFTIEAVQ